MKNCPKLMVGKQPKQTMGNRSEWTLHQRGLTDDKYTQGNTLNIISDQKIIMKTTMKDYCTYIKIANKI